MIDTNELPLWTRKYKEMYRLLKEVVDNADEADLENEVYLDKEIINRIKEMIEE